MSGTPTCPFNADAESFWRRVRRRRYDVRAEPRGQQTCRVTAAGGSAAPPRCIAEYVKKKKKSGVAGLKLLLPPPLTLHFVKEDLIPTVEQTSVTGSLQEILHRW